MLSGSGATGHAGELDGLPVALLNIFGGQGDGRPRIEEGRHPPTMIWSPNRHAGPTFLGQNHDVHAETLRAMERYSAETVAMGGAGTPTIGAADLKSIGDELDEGPNEEARLVRTRQDPYLSRLKFLRDEAVHDGYVLNPASEIDFRDFARSAPGIRRGNLVLMDNGNLRAIWKDENGTRLGLQFLGGRMVQFVIFKRRKQGQPISRVSGRDSLRGLQRQIVAFELNSLLYA